MQAAVIIAVTRDPFPTVGSVARATGLTKSGAMHHLNVLDEKGLIRWPGRAMGAGDKRGTIRSRLVVVGHFDAPGASA
jgi:hypothetical protein